ncbi:MAG TPA: carboxypeptidase regulatory-like domain-containing protein [Humisphaera sp.]
MNGEPNEPRDASPDDHLGEDVLARAVAAVRDVPVPDGLTPLLKARTLQAMRASSVAAAPWLSRWAAIVLIGATAAAGTFVGGRAYFAGRAKPQSVGQQKAPQGQAPQQAPSSDYANLPEVAGLVSIEGPSPLAAALLVPPEGGPTCANQHDQPRDESILVAPSNGVANVVVYLSEGLPAGREFAAPAEAAVVDQRDSKFYPRIVTAQVGQALVAKNSDPYFHTVHTNSRRNEPANVAQPKPDPVGVKLKRIAEPETFKVTCDLHPWMVAWVAAFDHPYHAVTSADGSFRMPPLEPGTYRIKAWHERLGAVEQEFTVGQDWKAPPIKLRFTQKQLAAALADQIPTADASAVVKPPCCVK